MEAIVERLKKLLEFNCRQVIDDDHPLQVDAVGDQAHLVLEVYGRPEDMALSLGAPCSQGTNPHGTMHVAVSGLEKPLAAAVTGGVLDADTSATAGEGEAHAEPRP